MASGRPLVTVDLPVLREVLGDPPVAMVVPPDSPAELARQLATVLDDSERAKKLACAARERVEDFTWETRARRILRFVYRESRRDLDAPG